MPVLKTTVFIASRFREFAEIRTVLTGEIANSRRLRLEPINLDDGHVNSRPPLSICLTHVRQAEFLILLLGDTYGDLAPNLSKSFTHLEYDEAVRPDSNTEILVFYLGAGSNPGRLPQTGDRKQANWYRQLQENHTIGFLDPSKSAQEIANEVLQELFIALYERSLGEISIDSVEEQSNLAADAGAFAAEWTELASLEAQDIEAKGIALLDDEKLNPQTQPAAVAAREQRQEAQRAIDIGDYASAIKHLEESLQRRPVDFKSNYWLAQLFVALRKKAKYPDITQLLQRATSLAKKDDSSFRIAACHMLWARAASMANRPEEAMRQANEAVQVCPRYSRAYVELARQHIFGNRKYEAVQCLKKAFFIYPGTFRQIASDPTFRPVRHGLQEELCTHITEDIASLLETERRLVAVACRNTIIPAVPTNASLSALIEAGRTSVRRQYDLVCEMAMDASNAVRAQEEAKQNAAFVDPQIGPDSVRKLKGSLLQAQQALQKATMFHQRAEGSLASWKKAPTSRKGVYLLAAAAGGFTTCGERSLNRILFCKA